MVYGLWGFAGWRVRWENCVRGIIKGRLVRGFGVAFFSSRKLVLRIF